MDTKTEATKPKLPKGIPYIIGNEAAERFSYYGMKGILVIYMTKYLSDLSGQPDFMSQPEAMQWYHSFGSAVYFFPIFGAIISDVFWNKYKTVITLSLVYCLGHLALAVLENRLGLAVGLTLIAIGSGGIKPCVATHMGDQFSEENKSLMSKAFSAFYFSVNFGSVFATAIIPITLAKYGPSVAFGIPGILMFLATLIFWRGRKHYRVIPPSGIKKYKEEITSREGLSAIGKLLVLYFFVAVFWSLFEQTGSAWVLQADRMDRNIDLTFGLFEAQWLKFELLPSQVHTVNPIFVMLLIPFFTYVVYPFVNRFFAFTPLRKITLGFIISASAYYLTGMIETWLDAGEVVSVWWQILGFLIITVGEVLVAITALEFSYTQAPNSMKSLIMSIKYLSVTMGNLIAVVVNTVIKADDGTMTITGTEYYMFFFYLMLATVVAFIVVSIFYKEKTYIQPNPA